VPAATTASAPAVLTAADATTSAPAADQPPSGDTEAAGTAQAPAHSGTATRRARADPRSPADTAPAGSGTQAGSQAKSDSLADPVGLTHTLGGGAARVPQGGAQAAPQGHLARPDDADAHRARRTRGGRPAPPLPLIDGDSMSEWLVLSIAMAAACVVVITIVLINNRHVRDDDDTSETPDVMDYMTMMIGVIYAIVLGLAIAGVWEGRGAAQESVRQEAQALHEVQERVQVYPPDVRDRIRADVDAYVSYVVNTEWPHMTEHETVTDKGGALLDTVRGEITQYAPKTDLEGQAYQPLVDAVAAADDARGTRAQNAGPTMPGVVWFGLITGAVVTVGLIFLLQIRRTFRELLLAGLFSVLIAFLLFLIWDFDAAYGRGISATAQPFLDLFPNIRS
jgi:hypothetical protein